MFGPQLDFQASQGTEWVFRVSFLLIQLNSTFYCGFPDSRYPISTSCCVLQTNSADLVLRQDTSALLPTPETQPKNKQTNKKPRLFFTSSKTATNSRPLNLHTKFQRREKKTKNPSLHSRHFLSYVNFFPRAQSCPNYTSRQHLTCHVSGKAGVSVQKRGFRTQLHNPAQK